jgi:hypothetical protein
MKTFSDIFSCLKRVINKVGNRVATTALFMVAAVTMSFAQDITIIEGSVGRYSVEYHEGNTFFWTLNDDAYKVLDSTYVDFFGIQKQTDITVQFLDRDRTMPQLVYLVVTETGKNGCSTKRALSIEIEPNNMYLEFAKNSTQDCYSVDDYLASLNVGVNFNDKKAGVPIPESRFPLNVRYSIVNTVTNDTVYHNVVVEYNESNKYTLLVTDAKGEPDQTVTYWLEIISVVDKQLAEIEKDPKDGGNRMQIRVINHLPQTGNMEMAMAYSVVMERM